MAARFVLGSFEASVAPTFIAIVQMCEYIDWENFRRSHLLTRSPYMTGYRRGEQTNRNAAWYSMLGVVNIVCLDNIPLLLPLLTLC